EIDSNKVIHAAQMAGIHEMILQFPDGYDTRLGEGGIIISGGQKQRLALARALYGNPTLIVLDEPSSNLDDMGERALLFAVSKLKEMKKTVFMITHRTTMLTLTDKIIFLLNGTIYAYGPSMQVLKALQELNAKQAAEQTALNEQRNKLQNGVNL
ncbi:MAG: ATP-binding cassette domain-containing protein, partial [Candidatus Micrarchaeaceae archaeon]